MGHWPNIQRKPTNWFLRIRSLPTWVLLIFINYVSRLFTLYFFILGFCSPYQTNNVLFLIKVFWACAYTWILLTLVHCNLLVSFFSDLSLPVLTTKQMTSDYLLTVQITKRTEVSNALAAIFQAIEWLLLRANYNVIMFNWRDGTLTTLSGGIIQKEILRLGVMYIYLSKYWILLWNVKRSVICKTQMNKIRCFMYK